jgi:integrase
VRRVRGTLARGPPTRSVGAPTSPITSRPISRAPAGIDERRIYDLRHTYATFSLAAGVSLFTLSRRMGTSVEMIDRTYGHLAPDAEEYERGLLDAFDASETERKERAE